MSTVTLVRKVLLLYRDANWTTQWFKELGKRIRTVELLAIGKREEGTLRLFSLPGMKAVVIDAGFAGNLTETTKFIKQARGSFDGYIIGTTAVESCYSSLVTAGCDLVCPKNQVVDSLIALLGQQEV